MASQRKALTAILLCGIVVAVAWYFFAFGTAILCCSQVLPNRYRWFAEKIAYGAVPFLLAIGIAVSAARLVAKECGQGKAWLICSTLVLGTGFIDLTVFWRLHLRYDDGLKREWNAESRIFDWGSGQIRLPAGFRYEKLNGIDTMMGRFISEDGRVVVEHDIGELAGEHGHTSGNEVTVGGFRVRTRTATYVDSDGAANHVVIASFPDCGCANFYSQSSDELGQAAIHGIVQSFRPRRELLSGLRSLMPEVWRTDCRYRFRLPDVFVQMLDKVL